MAQMTQDQMATLSRGQIIEAVRRGCPFVVEMHTTIGTLKQGFAYVVIFNTFNLGWTTTNRDPRPANAQDIPTYFDPVPKDCFNIWGAVAQLAQAEGGQLQGEGNQGLDFGYLFLDDQKG